MARRVYLVIPCRHKEHAEAVASKLIKKYDVRIVEEGENVCRTILYMGVCMLIATISAIPFFTAVILIFKFLSYLFK